MAPAYEIIVQKSFANCEGDICTGLDVKEVVVRDNKGNNVRWSFCPMHRAELSSALRVKLGLT